jgi:hypothetical protein
MLDWSKDLELTLHRQDANWLEAFLQPEQVNCGERRNPPPTKQSFSFFPAFAMMTEPQTPTYLSLRDLHRRKTHHSKA